MRLDINMMRIMMVNKEIISNFDTEQVYSYDSILSRTDNVMPFSRTTLTIQNIFIGTINYEL
jgi:hypothetical protein